MRNVLCNRDIGLITRKRISRCYVWTTLLYEAETWTSTKSMLKKIDAFELWAYRRMLRISWKDRISNEIVLHRIQSQRIVTKTIKERKLQYFGHLVRRGDLQRVLMEAKVARKRGRGRPKTSWTDNIKSWTGLSYGETIVMANDGERWRIISSNLRETQGGA